MTNKQDASGFTLIELIIGLVIVIALSTTAVSIYYHYFHIELVSTKISDSIKRIKNATTIYYFDKKSSAQNLNFTVLLANGYLDVNSIYRGEKQSNKANFNFNYTVTPYYKTGPGIHTIDHITIDLITYQHIHLNQAHPNKRIVRKDKNRMNYYDYQWNFIPILPAGQEANIAQSEYLNRLTTGNMR